MAWAYKTIKLALEGTFLRGTLVDHDKINTELNQLGADGWELVSAGSISEGSGVSTQLVVIFKRPGE
jgi:hypothetical protein